MIPQAEGSEHKRPIYYFDDHEIFDDLPPAGGDDQETSSRML